MEYGLQGLRAAITKLRALAARLGSPGASGRDGPPPTAGGPSIAGTIYEIARLGPWAYRPDIDRFEFDDRFYALYGTTVAQEGRFMTWDQYVGNFVHPADLRLVEQVRGQASVGQRPASVDHRIVRRDGTVRIIRVWGIAGRDGDNATVYGVNQDITECKLMEQDLLSSREQLSVAAKLACLGPWQYDYDKGLFEFGDEFYVLYGTTVAREGRFMTWIDYVDNFVHPDDAALVREVIADGRMQGPSIIEHRIVRRDGAVRTIRVWRGKINRDPDGNIEKIFGGNQDITERIEDENALRQSEERLKATLGALPDLLLRLDAGGKIHDCRIPEHYAGYLLGADACDTVDAMLPAPLAQLVKELVASSPLGKTKTANYSGQINDAVCSCEIRTAAINKNEALVIIRDQTELYRAQREVQRLDNLNLIGEMAASIGHELRNPLTTVRGYLQFLSCKDQSLDRGGMFQVLIGELDRANAIITEFLTLAKNKAVKKERKNINNIIAAIYPLLEVDATAGSKTISLELDPELPYTRLDESEFRQLLLNLVRNGLEAMPDNGRLRIMTLKDGKHALLSVRDQGPGIPASVIPKLGTPFVTTKERGTGLGLSICYSIAARHGAVIDYTTGPGGTEFTVRFKSE